MGDADVIELGSSDEETETSVKKVSKEEAKPIIVSNARSLQIPVQVKNATKFRSTLGSVLPKTPPKIIRPLMKHIRPQHINPMSVIRSSIIANGGTIVNRRIPTNGQNAKIPVAQSKNCLTKLPPGITVTRTVGEKAKRRHLENPMSHLVIKRQKLDKRSKKTIDRICPLSTVDPANKKSDTRLENDTPIVLDDDDQGSDEIVDEPMTTEVLNEDELTDTTPPIENIVIEDSPVKPPLAAAKKLTQRTVEMVEIIIEDSPLKEATKEIDRPKTPEVMESKLKYNEMSEPLSKKKLEFVKTGVVRKEDIEKTDVKPKDGDKKKDVKLKDDVKKNDIEEKKDDTVKKDDTAKKDDVAKIDDMAKKDDIAEKVEMGKKDEMGKRDKMGKKDEMGKKDDTAKKDDPTKKDDQVKKDDEETYKSDEKVKADKVEKLVDKEKFSMSAIEAKAALKRDDDLEFHPSYQRFIDLCLEMDRTSDMKKIVEKKVICYYKNVDKSFTSSEMFINLVEEKVAAMKVHPSNLYLYIKDVVDELRVHRKTGKTVPSSSAKGASSSGASYIQKGKEKGKEKDNQRSSQPSEEDEEAGPSPTKKVRKLEKALRKLNRAIQKLEEQEVDFDEDGDSAYLLADNAANCALELAEMGGDVVRDRDWKERYKARLLRVYTKLSHLTGVPHEKREHVRLEPRAGHPSGPARRLQAWLRQRPALAGAPLPFPDFHDVVKCVRDANRKDGLGWSEAQIMEEARDLFVRVGRKLQRRRQESEWHSVAGLLPPVADPADESPELRERLDNNAKVAGKRVKDVIDRYAERQNTLRLEPRTVDDMDVDKSENSGLDDGDDELYNKPGTSGSIDHVPASGGKIVTAEAKSPIAEVKDLSEKVEKVMEVDNNEEKMDVDEKKRNMPVEKASKVEEKSKETEEKAQKEAIEERVQEDSAQEIIQGAREKSDASIEMVQDESAEEIVPKESAKEVLREKLAEKVIQDESTEEVIQDDSPEEVIQDESAEEMIQEKVVEEVIQDKSAKEIIQEKVAKEVIQEKVAKQVIQDESADEIIQEKVTKEVDQNKSAEEIIKEKIPEEVIQDKSADEIIQEKVAEEVIRDKSAENVTEQYIQKHATKKIVQEVSTEEVIQKDVVEENIEDEVNETEQQITVPVSDTDESNRILSLDNESDNIIDDIDDIIGAVEDRTDTKKDGKTLSTGTVAKVANYENELPVPVSDSEESNRILSSDNDVNFVEKSEKTQAVKENLPKSNSPLTLSEDVKKNAPKKSSPVNGKSNSESEIEVITSDRVESDIDELHLLKHFSVGRSENSGLSESSGRVLAESSQNSQASQNDDAVMDVNESSVDVPSNAEDEIIDLDKKALLEIDGDTEDDTDGGRDSDVVITCFNLASTEDECDDYMSRKIEEKKDVKVEAIEAGKEDSDSIQNIDSVESVTSEVVLLI